MGSIIVSCAVIYYAKNTNEFLVCHPTGERNWSLPKGKIDEDDGGDEYLCAVREMKEETGIDISKDKLIRLGRFDYYRKERGNKVDKDLVVFLYPASHGVPENYLSCGSTFTSKKSPDDMRGRYLIKNKVKFMSDEIGYSYPECDDFRYIQYEAIDELFHEDGKRVLKLAFSSQAFKNAMPRLDEGLRIVWFNDEERAYFQAAGDGCIEELQWYVERGNDVDIYDENGFTALIGAVLKGHAQCVEYLIKAGADVNFYTSKNYNPLIFSITHDTQDITKMLLNAGADPTAVAADPGDHGRYGTTPLHFASGNGYLEAMEAIIDSGVEIDHRDTEGNTALHIAAKARIPSAVKMLLETGADPNAQNRFGNTPIVNASNQVYYFVNTSFGCDQKSYFQEDESYDCINLLLAASADPNAQRNDGAAPLQIVSEAASAKCVELLLANGADPNAQDKDGSTALHKAAYIFSIDCMKLLLTAGADLNIQDQWGNTPLQEASRSGFIECVKFLLGSGANIRPLGSEGNALYSAARYPEITRFLIDNGADVSGRTKFGAVPLHRAAVSSYKSLKILLEAGAEPDACDALGYTAMHYAAAADRPGNIKLLAKYGADPSIHSTEDQKECMLFAGSTPMHAAARNKHPNCIKALAAIGTALSPIDRKGRTPLHYSAINKRPECVKVLCDLGADVNAVENSKSREDIFGRKNDEAGQTPLHCAAKNGSDSCCEILLNAGADTSIKNVYGHTAPEIAHGKAFKIFKKAGLYD